LFQAGLFRAGGYAWTAVGIAVTLALAVFLMSRISLIVVPLVLALFPAALLAPLADWLTRHRVPAALAAFIVLVGALALLVGSVAALVPAFMAQASELSEAVSRGIEMVEQWLPDLPFGPKVSTVPELLRALEQRIPADGEVIDRTIEAARRTAEVTAATLFMLVALFFYLKDGRRIVSALIELVPAVPRPRVEELSARVWWTVGRYFRGQLLVALVDAVFIGLGIWLLGVPLVIPLAVLVFLGGLFPIVGAFLSGLLAVLVALADGGFGTGLATLAVVIAVQQLEGNVLEPFILSRVIRLHPLLILVSIGIGGILLGVLGAFLAVPLAASIARVVEYAREQQPAAGTPG
jgi:predicted PurR-regulated permease PerM